VNYDNSLVVTITLTCYSWAPSSGDHSFTLHFAPSPGRHITSLFISLKFYHLSFILLSVYKFDPYPLVQDDLQLRMLLRGLKV